MPMYAVDSKRQVMTATGIVQAVTEWEDKPGGGRRATDRQARDDQSGMPLWLVEVMYRMVAFGRESTATGMVRVGGATRPEVAPLSRIEFDGLSCDVRTNKGGGFEERWSADAITGVKQARANASAGAGAS
jgi:hypothetical protein